MTVWLHISFALMAITAAAHSWLGEKRIIGPAIAARQAYLANPFMQQITRFAWHAMSVFVLGNAATVIWPGTPEVLIRLIGALWIGIGLVGLAVTRGRHVGWPVIVGAGLAAWLGTAG
ncbi:MAG: hypothetical protein ACKOPO_08150 [Novosphingobium sp.]